MIGPATRTLLLCAGLAGAQAALAVNPSLTLLTEDGPPFNMPSADGRGVSGISSDILRRVLSEQKITYSITMLPWSRAFATAERNGQACVFSTTITEERRTHFKWAGPLAVNVWTLFARAGTRKLATLEEAKGHPIGGYVRDVLSTYLAEQGYMMDLAPEDYLNLQKLLHGRIDYWASGALTAQYYARRANLQGLTAVYSIREVPVYLACNPGVPDKVIQSINDGIAKLYAEGEAQKIIAKYQ